MPCQENCKSCIDLFTCNTCIENYFFYSDFCYKQCPNNTYRVDFECYQCSSPCLYCSISNNNCTLCGSPFVLYENSCVKECPINYTLYFQECIPSGLLCAPNCTEDLLKNSECDWACYVQACNFDNGNCPPINYTNTLDLTALPMPMSITGGAAVGVTGVSSVVFGSSALAVGSSLMSLLESAAVISLIGTVGTTNGTHGRIALDIENTDIKIVFTILFIITFLKIAGNISFALVFCK